MNMPIKSNNKLIAVILTIVMAFSVVLPVLGAEENNVIYIKTADDLVRLSKNCTLDTWSEGKTVVLEADISLSNVDFRPIPTFSGTFEGGGHSITGLHLENSGDIRGLFRYVEKSGVVKDLIVKGNVSPEGRKDTLGGIVGCNRGQIVNCSFYGVISGKNTIGGVAGINEGTGQMVNCTFYGTVMGEHYIGGIAGQNYGSLIQCRNNGSVNTTEIEATLELESVNLEQLNSAENVPVGTDIGGIAGFSAGIIQSCENNADVGYEHMGYNVGGIVGRQSGYINGCVNNGVVRGRKDVGGIAGQMEPELTLKYNQSTLGRVLDELDAMQDTIDKLISDGESSSDSLSAGLDDLTGSIRGVKDTTSQLADSMTDWANENIDQINDVTARISWTLDQMEPIMDSMSDAMDYADDAVDELKDALDEADTMIDFGKDAADELEDAADDLQDAVDHIKEAFEHINNAIGNIRSSLGDSEGTRKAVNDAAEGFNELAEGFSEFAGATGAIQTALENAETDGENETDREELLNTAGELEPAMENVSASAETMGGALETLSKEGMTENGLNVLNNGMAEFSTAARELSSSCGSFFTALENYRTGGATAHQVAVNKGLRELKGEAEKITAAQAEIDKIYSAIGSGTSRRRNISRLRVAVSDMDKAITSAGKAAQSIDTASAGLEDAAAGAEISGEVADIETKIAVAKAASENITKAAAAVLDEDTAENLWTALDKAVEAMRKCANEVKNAVDSGSDVIDDLNGMLKHGGKAVDGITASADHLSDAMDRLDSAAEDARDVINTLADKPDITFSPISSDITEQGDALDDAMDEMIDKLDALNNIATSSTDILLDDFRAISNHVSRIIDILREDDSEDEDISDRFEDVSDDEKNEERTSGRISDSANFGVVEGDLNTAGIVGSMAVEYDFDPEDDLTESGDRSVDFRYQAKAVVSGCVNEGEVTGRRDYIGGIVGRMDLGSVTDCAGYGRIESSNGGYVGGIAGASYGTVRDSWAKCALSGKDYIGGIAGMGSMVYDCRSLIEIEEGRANLGAIAGDMEDEGEMRGNLFVSDELGGLDDISYSGVAEPTDFGAMTAFENTPEDFTKFALTFVADDVTVAVIPFSYGEGIASLPDIPAKEGYSASWPELDYNNLTFSRTLEAEYDPYETALASESGPLQILVDGAFSKGAEISYFGEELSWSDDSGKIHTGTAYTVTVIDPMIEDISYTVHYHLPEKSGRYVLWVQNDEDWERRDFEKDGSYLMFKTNENPVTFFVERDNGGIIAVTAIGVLAAAGLVLIVLRHKNGGEALKKHPKDGGGFFKRRRKDDSL